MRSSCFGNFGILGILGGPIIAVITGPADPLALRSVLPSPRGGGAGGEGAPQAPPITETDLLSVACRGWRRCGTPKQWALSKGGVGALAHR